MVPHLATALNGPINELEARILDSMPAIERWFRLEWMEHTPPFYTAVDVRNAGFKLAPVETDLYPDGWNHLTDEMLPLAVQAAMAAIEKICPEAKNLLVIPERTGSVSHLENVARLGRIFSLAGLNVRYGSLDPSLKESRTFELPDGDALCVEPLLRTQRRLGLKNFDPCTILLNNRLSKGVPGVVEDLHEQYVLPPLHGSDSVRRRVHHHQAYEEVAKKFAKLLGMDPWLIHPMYGACTLEPGAGREDVLRTAVEAVMSKVRRKYKEYGINEKPFVVIKEDGLGGEGLPPCVVRDAREMDEAFWARLGRHLDPAATCGLLVQEGVPTHERINDAVAEPVVYMMDRYVVGGFYRIHTEPEGVGAKGASYVPLAFAKSHHLPKSGARPGASAPNRFYMYGVIGRLAMLAASYELEATDPNAEVYD